LDASHEMKGNKQYFDILAKAMDSDEVGEAFYNYCIEFAKANDKFSPQFDRPISESMKKNIASSALPYMNFIKDKFILNKKGLDLKLKDLYEQYESYCESKKVKYVEKKADFPARLEELGIKTIMNSTKHKNSNWVECDFKKLLEIFKKLNLIDITDEFNEPEREDPLGMDDDQEVIKEIIIQKEIPSWIQEETEYQSKKQERQDKINAQLDELEKKKPKSTIDNIYNLMK